METYRLSRSAAASAVLLSLALGILLGVVLGTRRAPPPDVASSGTTGSGGIPGSALPAPPASPGNPPPASASRSGAATVQETRPKTMIDRLQRFRSLLVEKAKRPTGSDLSDLYRAMTEGWAQLHEAVLKDPAGFFAFVRAPGNEEVCEGLLHALSPSPMMGVHFLGLMEKQPPAVLEGLADLLAHGAQGQKLAAAQVARELLGSLPDGKGEALLRPCLELLRSDDPRAQAVALDILRERRKERLEESLDLACSLWNTCRDPEVRMSCLGALAGMKSPAADQAFFERLTDAMRDHAGHASDPYAGPVLDLFKEKCLTSSPEAANRYGALILSSLHGASDPLAFQTCARAALELPVPLATSILEQSLASAPTPETQSAVRAVLDQIRGGEVRPGRLQALLGTGGGPLGR